MSVSVWPSSLFRVIDPAYPPDNIYRYAARSTVSLGPVLIATVAQKALPWLEAEVISENNYHWRRRGGPQVEGKPDHLALQEERPAAYVGLSASITNATPRALELIGIYRTLPEHLRPRGIIVGGWHAGDCPEEFLAAGADVVVHGEGVEVVARVLEALASGGALESIPGISYRTGDAIVRNGPDFLSVSQKTLEALPDPDFDLVRYAKIRVVPVSRTWGCSGRCRFCRVKQAPRSRSPQRFVGQLQRLVSKGYREFFVVDDRVEEDLEGFTAWLQALTDWRQARRVRGVDLTVQARLSLARHPEVLSLMRRAGVRTVCIGYESPIPEELWAMRKPLAPDKIVEWTRVWKRFGFYIHAMMIFGYPMPPGRTAPANALGRPMSARERGDAFWRFLRKARPHTLQVLLLTPIPGTEDWAELDRQGRILKELGWNSFDGLHLVFKPDAGMDPVAVQREVLRLHRKFYAFHWLWLLGPAPLVAHLVNVGAITVSMPFLWLPLFLREWPVRKSFARASAEAWEVPRRIFRNARKRFLAYLIVQRVQKNLGEFERQMTALVRTTGEESSGAAQ